MKAIKENDKNKKRLAIALATGIIASSFPASFTYAEANVIDRLNSELGVNINGNIVENNIITADKRTVQEIAKLKLSNGKEIRVVKDIDNEIILQELNSNGQYMDKDKIGQVEFKEIKESNNGGYELYI